MIEKTHITSHALREYLTEYKILNTNGQYRPVAVGRYGIRTRESIYSKELAKDYSKNRLIFKNTLTVGMGSVQMDIGILTDDVIYSVSPAYHTYRINGIDCTYLRYCLQQKNADMFAKYMKRGSRQGKSIDLSRWIDYEIPVYPSEEQKEIVHSLDVVSTIIEQRLNELKRLDDLVKARFVEMFGDPDTNPFRWDEDRLSNHLSVLGGYAFKSDLFSDTDGIPVLRIGNVNSGFFKPVNMVFYQDDNALDRYKIYPGDLVMSLTGTVGKDDYGNVCMLDDTFEVYYLNQRNAKLEIGDGLDKYYLSVLLKFDKIKKKLTGISRGVRQANISNKDILTLEVPIPPMELQKQFADFIKQLDKSKFVKTLQLLYNLQRLITNREVSP